MEEDGFVLVRRKKKSAKVNKGPISEPLSSLDVHPIETNVTVEEIGRVKAQVASYKLDITTGPVWSAINNKIVRISDHEEINEIVCYGLGSLLGGPSMFASRQQLAVLLALRDRLSLTAQIFDPVFNRQDKQLLSSYDITVLPHNDYGKRTVISKTLFFMPRCPFELFNNILWKNWFSLDRVVLFGNDLTYLDTQITSSHFESRFKFISKALPVIETFRLSLAGTTLENVMNNCVIHTFTSGNPDLSTHADLAAAEPVLQ